MERPDVLRALREAISSYDASAAAAWAETCIRQGLDPVEGFDAAAAEIKAIGDRFDAGECWLPDLVGAAGAMQAATRVLEAEIVRRHQTSRAAGRVVAGAVLGDIHSIGIEIVCALLAAAGFDVNYLGVDVSPEAFIAAIEERDADILAMSALLTVTAAEQRKVIEALAARGLRERVKVMVGGGAISQDFADKIGADGYAAVAPGAVALARSFVGV